jgi:glycosyltransferase involved in cell wall biosynthesis
MIMNHPDMELPLVTVVIPVLNREDLLPDAIRSVIEQTHPNWELFVVDDGSTDHTVEIARSFCDPRIHVMVLPHIGNIGQLRNIGAQAGTGKWITFLDSDDLWLPHRIEVQVKALESESKRWGFGAHRIVDENGKPFFQPHENIISASGWVTADLITCRVSASIGSIMVERALFDDVCGFCCEPELLFREDYELAIRLSAYAEAYALTDVLVLVREHSNRSTHHFDEGHLRTAQTCEHLIHYFEEEEYRQLLRRKKAYHLAEASVQSCKKKKFAFAGKQVWEALVEGDNIGHLISVGYRCAETLLHSEKDKNAGHEKIA